MEAQKAHHASCEGPRAMYCMDLPTHHLPRLKLQLPPRTPEAPQRAMDMVRCETQPESPRTPKGACIPLEAYTICPNAPGPKHLEVEYGGCNVPPPPAWWGACGK